MGTYDRKKRCWISKKAPVPTMTDSDLANSAFSLQLNGEVRAALPARSRAEILQAVQASRKSGGPLEQKAIHYAIDRVAHWTGGQWVVKQADGVDSNKYDNEDEDFKNGSNDRTLIDDDGSNSNDLSWTEKEMLVARISALPPDQMSIVVQVLTSEPDFAGVDEKDAEVELDITELSAAMFRKLKQVVSSFPDATSVLSGAAGTVPTAPTVSRVTGAVPTPTVPGATGAAPSASTIPRATGAALTAPTVPGATGTATGAVLTAPTVLGVTGAATGAAPSAPTVPGATGAVLSTSTILGVTGAAPSAPTVPRATGAVTGAALTAPTVLGVTGAAPSAPAVPGATGAVLSTSTILGVTGAAPSAPTVPGATGAVTGAALSVPTVPGATGAVTGAALTAPTVLGVTGAVPSAPTVPEATGAVTGAALTALTVLGVTGAALSAPTVPRATGAALTAPTVPRVTDAASGAVLTAPMAITFPHTNLHMDRVLSTLATRLPSVGTKVYQCHMGDGLESKRWPDGCNLSADDLLVDSAGAIYRILIFPRTTFIVICEEGAPKLVSIGGFRSFDDDSAERTSVATIFEVDLGFYRRFETSAVATCVTPGMSMKTEPLEPLFLQEDQRAGSTLVIDSVLSNNMILHAGREDRHVIVEGWQKSEIEIYLFLYPIKLTDWSLRTAGPEKNCCAV